MTDDAGTTNARLSRLEGKYDDLAKQLGNAVITINQVEANQKHAEELNVLRFKSLDTAVGQIGADLKGFMGRIEGMIDGTVDNAQARAGRAFMEDFTKWRVEANEKLAIIYTPEQRRDIEARLDKHEAFETQARTIGKVAVFLVSTNVLSLLLGLYAIAQNAKP